ncbi:MAG: alpha/beta fold hydrolase [Syntrophaceae bacterium]|nr:alpha/beta fold hydrolase [Syntrophaceae bacterium]
MNISNDLIKIIELAIDTLIKAAGIDLRLHGVENVPDQPIVYVVNHFTRLETVLMPYIIKKKTNKDAVSLAHESFFSGRMKDFLDNVGAVSTADPNRDKIFIKALLSDSHPVIIFPEGQIIKDKKIIEKGKYLVYNAGIRRPPHSGAARIALLTEFLREKLRIFNSRRDKASIARIASRFDLEPADVDKIISKETHIVPVNITYYPVRARENALSRLAGKFFKNISTRLQEELEVEGPIILGKVDIDINFGRPIPAKSYISAKWKMKRMMMDKNVYLNIEDFKKIPAFRKTCIRLMHDYMNSIYGMTTVNHDHIMSYILTNYQQNSFSENDFKKRIFLAIEHLRKVGLPNCHTSLYQKQFYLITDDYHEKYENFIKEMVASNYIERENGVITKNSERFSVISDFQTIRRDNIIEVLRNEIEPLRNLTRVINSQKFLPAFFIKWKLRNSFIKLDRELFDKDYQLYYLPNESKPKNIGEPFFLKHFFSKKGVILVHGYMAAPEEIRPLADHLYKNGYNVYGVRLRGHGTAPEDLATRNWEKWYDSASRAYIIMKSSVKTFSIAGFSMGGGIALLQAANKPGRFASIISINVPLKLKDVASKFAPAIVAWNTILTKMNVDKWKMEFVENEPENPQINYVRNPVRGGYELEKLMKLVENHLKDVADPTLIIQASNDPVVDPVSGQKIYDSIGTKEKQLFMVKANHHGILRGQGADEVNAKVLEFLSEINLGKTPGG